MSNYLVSVCGANAPTKVHSELSDAISETERLALMPQNKNRRIYVVQIVATLEPRTSHEWSKE